MKDIDNKMMKLADKWIDRAREKDNWSESFLNNISRRKGMPVKPTDPAMRCLNALLRDVPELKDYDVEEVWHYLQWRCREACDWPGDVDWEPPECYDYPNTDLNSAEKFREELMHSSGCSLDDGYAWLGMVTNMGRNEDDMEVFMAIMQTNPYEIPKLLIKAFGKDAVLAALNPKISQADGMRRMKGVRKTK